MDEVRKMETRGTGSTWTLEMKKDFNPDVFRKEMSDLVEFIISGAQVGNVHRNVLNNTEDTVTVKGLKMVMNYAFAVEAPAEAWAKLKELTEPQYTNEPEELLSRRERRRRERDRNKTLKN